MKIICVNNNKGGSAKTTTVTNLAGVLASKRKKVLIIDTDNQGNVSLTFDKNPDLFEYTLYDVLIDKFPPEKAIVSINHYIDILPSNDSLIGFDFEVIGKPQKYPKPFEILKNTCFHLREKYDYILIDTPPSLSLMVGNVFTLADSVLIPFAPEIYSMRSLIKVVETIKDFQKEYNPNLRILGVVGTIVSFQTTLHQEVMQETRKYCTEKGIFMFETYIPRTIQFASAVAYDKSPATLLKKKKEAIRTYYELWKEIEKIYG